MFFRRASSRAFSTAGAAQQWTSRLAGVAAPIINAGRISLSFLGQVASHSKLTQFPDIAQATQGISGFIAAFGNGAWKTVTIKQAVELLTEGVKIGGFFVVGEMIGRGSIIGYHIPGTDHALQGGGH